MKKLVLLIIIVLLSVAGFIILNLGYQQKPEDSIFKNGDEWSRFW